MARRKPNAAPPAAQLRQLTLTLSQLQVGDTIVGGDSNLQGLIVTEPPRRQAGLTPGTLVMGVRNPRTSNGALVGVAADRVLSITRRI